MKKTKICVIGLDGATFDVIKPMVEAGHLPAFARLMKEGSWGNLRSTVLPITPAAWSSFMTGRNPGKHGVFGFLANRADSQKIEYTNSLSIKTKKIWDYFESEKKVGLIDIPLTYPPEKINGCMISGIHVPSEDCIFTYPPELHTELIREIGDYKIEKQLKLSADGSQIDQLKELYAYTETRIKATKYLLAEKGPFDFFMTVLRCPDLIQHSAFKYLDRDYAAKHPEETSKYGMMIQQFYEKIDKFLAEMLKLIDDDCTLIVMSDHGMGPVKKLFYVNRWLKQEGFLNLKKYVAVRKRGMKWHFRDIRDILDRKGFSSTNGFLPGFIKRMKITYPALYEKHPYSLIDWKRTKAYANPVLKDGTIRINLKGREIHGIVEEKNRDKICSEIIKKLKNIKDPENGKYLMEAVHKREEVYSGPYVKDAPDIFSINRDIEYAYKSTVIGDELFEEPPSDEPANHRMNGIFMMTGPQIRGGINLPVNNIIDIAPTILYLMGYKIPEDMDGKVIVQAIDEAFLSSERLLFSKGAVESEDFHNDVKYNEKDRKEIEESLRSLGYLS